MKLENEMTDIIAKGQVHNKYGELMQISNKFEQS